MRLSVISSFILAGGILAAPYEVEKRGSATDIVGSVAAPYELEKRGSLTDSLSGIVTILNGTVGKYTKDINTLVSGVKGSLTGSFQIIANANIDFEAITKALVTALASIGAVTSDLAGGLVGAAVGLTQTEVAKLTQALQTLTSLIQGIQITVTGTATNLHPAVALLLTNEVVAIKTLASAVAAPLVAFTEAVSQFQVNITPTVTGLDTAITGLQSIVGNLISL